MDRSTLGHPGKYTYCIAEDEENSPWEPLHVERGLPREASAVTAFAALGPLQVENRRGDSGEAILTAIADSMLALGPQQGEVVVVIAQEHLMPLKAEGWTKERARRFVYQRAQRTAQEWADAYKAELPKPGQERQPVGVLQDPDKLYIVPAGGPAGTWSAVIPMWGRGINSRAVTRWVDTSGIM